MKIQEGEDLKIFEERWTKCHFLKKKCDKNAVRKINGEKS